MRLNGRSALASGLVVGGLMLAAGTAVAQEVTLNVWSDPVRLTMFDLYDKTHDNVKLNVTTIDPAGLVAKIQQHVDRQHADQNLVLDDERPT